MFKFQVVVAFVSSPKNFAPQGRLRKTQRQPQHNYSILTGIPRPETLQSRGWGGSAFNQTSKTLSHGSCQNILIRENKRKQMSNNWSDYNNSVIDWKDLGLTVTGVSQ
jgi:hypothetical protein